MFFITSDFYHVTFGNIIQNQLSKTKKYKKYRFKINKCLHSKTIFADDVINFIIVLYIIFDKLSIT